MMRVESLLLLMFEGSAKGDIDLVLESFTELDRTCAVADLPALVTAIQSEKSDFWLRELLSGSIARIGGCGSLSVLFDALAKGDLEGHDNDLSCSNLTEMAAADPKSCRTALHAIIAVQDHEHKELAQWLLEYCA